MENQLPEKCPYCGSENLIFAAYVYMQFSRNNEGKLVPVSRELPTIEDAHGGGV